MNDNPFKEWQEKTDRACGVGGSGGNNNGDKGASGCCWIFILLGVTAMTGVHILLLNIIV